MHEDGIENYTEILEILKLYGLPLYVENEADGIITRLMLAAIDNHEEIKEGRINDFSGLKLRPLIEYNVDLEESWTEHKWYSWRVNIKGYSAEDVAREVVTNEDGLYDWWEWDDGPHFSDEHGDSDRDGIQVVNIAPATPVESTTIKESETEYFSGYKIQNNNDLKVTKTVNSMCIHILKEFGKQEIGEMVDMNIEEVEGRLRNILKLYSWPAPNTDPVMASKQLIQFMWDKNVPDNYSPFIGESLPPIHEYNISQEFIEWDKTLKRAYVNVYDTNFNTVKCEMQGGNFWEYDYTFDDYEVLESDHIGEEEWKSVIIDGETVWTDFQKNANPKYDPTVGCE